MPFQAVEAPDFKPFKAVLAALLKAEAVPAVPEPADFVPLPENSGTELAKAPPKLPVNKFAPVLSAAPGLLLIALDADLAKLLTALAAPLDVLAEALTVLLPTFAVALPAVPVDLIWGIGPFDITFSLNSLSWFSNALTHSSHF
jgi:hypothetical protein